MSTTGLPPIPPPSPTKASDRLFELIKLFEGFRHEAYLCPAGVWTIGYGTTKGVKPGMVVTREEAEVLLRKDVAAFEAGVARIVKVPLNQNQFDALVSFSYNVGLQAFQSSTLARRLNKGDYQAAAKEFARWDRAGGRVLLGLSRRRDAEAKLFIA